MVEHSQGASHTRRWVRIARRAVAEFREDKVTLIASGVAFRVTLAIFPAVGILVWLASRFMNPDQAYAALQYAAGTLPDSTRDIIRQAMGVSRADSASGRDATSLLDFMGPLFSLMVALWSANSGAKALFIGLNTIFNRTERRSFLQLLLVTLVFTVGVLSISLLVIAVIVVGPGLLSATGTSEAWLTAWQYFRWPLFFVISAVSISMLYRYAPNHDRARPSFITAGGIVASLAFTGAATTFSWFIQHFSRLPITYGSLNTFIAFMIWLWLSVTLVLSGAELDAAIARDNDDRRSKKAGGS